MALLERKFIIFFLFSFNSNGFKDRSFILTPMLPFNFFSPESFRCKFLIFIPYWFCTTHKKKFLFYSKRVLAPFTIDGKPSEVLELGHYLHKIWRPKLKCKLSQNVNPRNDVCCCNLTLLVQFWPTCTEREQYRNQTAKHARNLMHTKFYICRRKKQYCFYALE